jgi:hypothetical protein
MISPNKWDQWFAFNDEHNLRKQNLDNIKNFGDKIKTGYIFECGISCPNSGMCLVDSLASPRVPRGAD